MYIHLCKSYQNRSFIKCHYDYIFCKQAGIVFFILFTFTYLCTSTVVLLSLSAYLLVYGKIFFKLEMYGNFTNTMKRTRNLCESVLPNKCQFIWSTKVSNAYFSVAIHTCEISTYFSIVYSNFSTPNKPSSSQFFSNDPLLVRC